MCNARAFAKPSDRTPWLTLGFVRGDEPCGARAVRWQRRMGPDFGTRSRILAIDDYKAAYRRTGRLHLYLRAAALT